MFKIIIKEQNIINNKFEKVNKILEIKDFFLLKKGQVNIVLDIVKKLVI